ncbi:hypothetical protein D3C83_68880 [compost metagenome]
MNEDAAGANHREQEEARRQEPVAQLADEQPEELHDDQRIHLALARMPLAEAVGHLAD